MLVFILQQLKFKKYDLAISHYNIVQDKLGKFLHGTLL